MAADEAIKFKVLLRKINCDPVNRKRILKEHLQFYCDEVIKDSFWHLVSSCPWGLQEILDSMEIRSPSIPQIKRLMNDFFEHFKETTYYREHYFDYACVSDPSPLTQIRMFLDKPSTNGLKTILRLYEEVDCRVKTIVDGHYLRRKYTPDWSEGPRLADSIRSLKYEAYDRAFARYKRENEPLREALLPHSTGMVVYRIYQGSKHVFQEGELAHFAPNMMQSMARIYRLVSDFSHTPRPTRPHGWYRFEL
jgi:hypothetical protein